MLWFLQLGLADSICLCDQLPKTASSLFGRSGGLVFLRDKDLEAGVTLRGRIYRLVREDDGCARRDYSLRFLQELTRNPTLLRRRKQALV